MARTIALYRFSVMRSKSASFLAAFRIAAFSPTVDLRTLAFAALLALATGSPVSPEDEGTVEMYLDPAGGREDCRR